LLFGRSLEDNAQMRLAWPTKVRVDNGCVEEEQRFPRGDARPDFMCVGAQKGGTSWLYQQLSSHPDFWMPPTKELHYFDLLGRTKMADPRPRDERDACFLERIKNLSALPYIDLENYARLFEPKGERLSGDITPAYSMLNDEIIDQIIDHFPNLKVIFFVRDPVERAWSQLSMGVRLGRIRAFDVENIDEVIRTLLKPGVLLRSYPSKIVARWRRHVRPELFRVYFFDDLQENPADLRRAVLDFLGADPNKQNGRRRVDYNSDAGIKKLRLSDKVRSRLAEFFKKELKTCADELGGPARKWPARYGFSLLWFLADLVDDVDLFAWCDWLG
jgi:hypothetical protein